MEHNKIHFLRHRIAKRQKQVYIDMMRNQLRSFKVLSLNCKGVNFEED
jgi:hypothetical protein